MLKTLYTAQCCPWPSPGRGRRKHAEGVAGNARPTPTTCRHHRKATLSNMLRGRGSDQLWKCCTPEVAGTLIFLSTAFQITLPRVIDISQTGNRPNAKIGISGHFSIHKGNLNLKFIFHNFSYAFDPGSKC